MRILLLFLDFDECTNGSALCTSNADCINTAGSYDCQCKDGYVGEFCQGINRSSIEEKGPSSQRTSIYNPFRHHHNASHSHPLSLPSQQQTLRTLLFLALPSNSCFFFWLSLRAHIYLVGNRFRKNIFRQ